MPFERVLECGLGRAGAELELGIERVRAKDIAVGPVARRRAGSAVADRAEVVSPLAFCSLALAEAICA